MTGPWPMVLQQYSKRPAAHIRPMDHRPPAPHPATQTEQNETQSNQSSRVTWRSVRSSPSFSASSNRSESNTHLDPRLEADFLFLSPTHLLPPPGDPAAAAISSSSRARGRQEEQQQHPVSSSDGGGEEERWGARALRRRRHPHRAPQGTASRPAHLARG